MSDSKTLARRVWGYICEGEFRPLPRWPGVDQVPPFTVKLPSGEVREIIWDPSEEVSDERPPAV
jgi:hypothetical protein